VRSVAQVRGAVGAVSLSAPSRRAKLHVSLERRQEERHVHVRNAMRLAVLADRDGGDDRLLELRARLGDDLAFRPIDGADAVIPMYRSSTS